MSTSSGCSLQCEIHHRPIWPPFEQAPRGSDAPYLLCGLIYHAFQLHHFIGDEILLARNQMWSRMVGISGLLSPREWELEAGDLGYVVLAVLRRMVVEFASPPNITMLKTSAPVSSHNLITRLGSDNEKTICPNIRVCNSAYFNFRVVHLVVFSFMGTLIISIRLFWFPGLAFWSRKKLGLDDFPRREWIEDHLFRVQKVRSRVGESVPGIWRRMGWRKFLL